MAWTTFGVTPNPTGQELDVNMAALARMGAYPCTVGGTANAITLTLLDANTPPNNAYQNYVDYAFVAGSTNSGAVTLKVGSLGVLNVYKDTTTGPIALTGGEIVQNCLVIATYDSTLNANAGGFHVRTVGSVNVPINPSQIQIGTGATITHFLTGLYTIAYTVVPANTTQDQVVTLANAQLGDIVDIGMTAAPGAGLMFNGRVPAVGSITLRAANVTAASIAAFTLTNVRLSAMGAS
jgi:hypothetical protein